jgi:hypothetical protein
MVGGRVRRPGLVRRQRPPAAAHTEMASLFACAEKLIKAWPGSAVISNEEAIISSFFLAMIFLLTWKPFFYLTRDKSLKIKFNYALIEFA